MSYLKFSRDAEREADLLPVEYAYAADYDPAEFVHFFETLRNRQKEKLSFVARAFADHPMTEERIPRAQKEITALLPAKDELGRLTHGASERVRTRGGIRQDSGNDFFAHPGHGSPSK